MEGVEIFMYHRCQKWKGLKYLCITDAKVTFAMYLTKILSTQFRSDK